MKNKRDNRPSWDTRTILADNQDARGELMGVSERTSNTKSEVDRDEIVETKQRQFFKEITPCTVGRSEEATFGPDYHQKTISKGRCDNDPNFLLH